MENRIFEISFLIQKNQDLIYSRCLEYNIQTISKNLKEMKCFYAKTFANFYHSEEVFIPIISPKYYWDKFFSGRIIEECTLLPVSSYGIDFPIWIKIAEYNE